jgi:hypothetical protein
MKSDKINNKHQAFTMSLTAIVTLGASLGVDPVQASEAATAAQNAPRQVQPNATSQSASQIKLDATQDKLNAAPTRLDTKRIKLDASQLKFDSRQMKD